MEINIEPLKIELCEVRSTFFYLKKSKPKKTVVLRHEKHYH